jgi:cell division protein FtsX
MSKGENKIMRRRLANAYLSSVISISLVLLLVGVASMLLVNAKSVSDYFKENMQVSVLMKDSVPEEKAEAFSESLLEERYIKTATFISRQQGEEELAELLGEDFVRCHRSYLVNLQSVSGLSKTRVRLDDGTELPLSRSAAASVHRAFVSYYKGEEHETV